MDDWRRVNPAWAVQIHGVLSEITACPRCHALVADMQDAARHVRVSHRWWLCWRVLRSLVRRDTRRRSEVGTSGGVGGYGPLDDETKTTAAGSPPSATSDRGPTAAVSPLDNLSPSRGGLE